MAIVTISLGLSIAPGGKSAAQMAVRLVGMTGMGRRSQQEGDGESGGARKIDELHAVGVVVVVLCKRYAFLVGILKML